MTPGIRLGVARRSLEHGGITRHYRRYVPPALALDSPTPLVVVLHGGGGTGTSGTHHGNWDRAAREHGFVVVAPDGLHGYWNGGGRWNDGNRTDDVGFLAAVIDDVAAELTVDPTRVHAAGFSNGGIMTYRLACEAGDRFAAVATVGCSLMLADPQPGRPISLVHVHGLSDGAIPFEGGEPVHTNLDPPPRYRPVREGLEVFVRANGCDPAPTVDEQGVVSTERWTRGHDDTEVRLVTIADGGHSWPGGRRLRDDLDEPSVALDATETIWRFFAEHPRSA